MLKKLFLVILIFFGLVTFAQSENSWIKKKDKSEIIEKTEEKKTSNWIKKKIKENKKVYKKEEKKITKEVKSWIKKKSKDKYITSIKDLPEGAIYFQGYSDISNSLIYGFMTPDTNSKLVDGYYETSKGFGYFNDGKTTCKIGSTVINVSLGEVTARVSGECTNGLKFTGKTTQEKNSGWGSARTSDGKERYFFDFNQKKNEIAKLYDDKKNSVVAHTVGTLPNETIDLKPLGKYYALLIGNSNYKNWTSLTSPVNDINAIGKILKSKYKFEKVITIQNGNRKNIFKKLKELSNITTDNDYVLIYYSGHGDEEGNQRYWIPVDGEKEYGFGDWININDIQVYIQEKIKNRHLVMMSDSCYFAMNTKGNQIVKNQKTESYQKLLKRRAVIIVGSGSNEPVEDVAQDKHSMFGMSFIKSLENNSNAIRMRDVVDNIILAHSGMQQQPYGVGIGAWGHSGGDFIFIAKE